MKKWLHAFRLRTLPLALSSVILGSFLAYFYGNYIWEVNILSIITTIFLQILSNLANDYGDAKKGTDNAERVGPTRAIQSGAISLQQMKRAIYICAILALISGVALVYVGTKNLDLNYTVFFILLGLAAIGAAVKYTMGKKPYGYQGLGDIFVFLFFGLTGVLGTFYLHTQSLPISIILPACTVGFLSTAVLNLNNMRDRINDENSGKYTLVVKLGIHNAKIYHTLLLLLGMALSVIFTLKHYYSPYQLIYLVVLPILLSNLRIVWKHQKPASLDPELKKIALGTLLYSVSFGIGLIIAYA